MIFVIQVWCFCGVVGSQLISKSNLLRIFPYTLLRSCTSFYSNMRGNDSFEFAHTPHSSQGNGYSPSFLICLLLVIVSASQSAQAKSKYPYDNIILQTATKYGVDPAFVYAVIKAESNFNPRAHSTLSNGKPGAHGLMQLMPVTAKRFGVSLENIYVPSHNIRGGIKYLSWLQKRFNGNLSLVLAGYNAGEGAVDKYRGIPPYKETQTYVKKVIRFYREFKGLPLLQKKEIRKNKPVLVKNNKKQRQQKVHIKKATPSSIKIVIASRENEHVYTSGSFHRVSSLTISGNKQPMHGYSRITETRRLQ